MNKAGWIADCKKVTVDCAYRTVAHPLPTVSRWCMHAGRPFFCLAVLERGQPY